MYHEYELSGIGVTDFELFYSAYSIHNEKLWAGYRNGSIKADELRWRRMSQALLEFKIGNEQLARNLGSKFLDLLPKRNLLFPDTVETLHFLQDKGYQLHLITNGFEETQHHKLRNSGIDHFFIEVITSEGSNSAKPKKEIFDYALKKANAMQHDSIMIGDSIEVDIQGAINAGIDQVFMNHINALCCIQPTYIVRSLKELKTIF